MAEEINKEQQSQQDEINDKDAKAGGEGNGAPENNNEPDKEENSEPVNLTQKQLDDLIAKAFAKGARAGKRQVSKTPKATDTADGGEDDEASKKAIELLQKANKRLLTGTIKSLAADVGLTAKGAKAALKLADFSECIKDDEVDEESVKDILEDFVKEYPEFKPKEETESKPWGMRQGNGQRMSGVEAAFFANNPDLK